MFTFGALKLKYDIIMQDYCYLNTTKMVELSEKMEGSEIKMLFAIIYCLNAFNRFRPI